MSYGSARHPDNQTSYICSRSTFSIPKLGGLVHDLVEGWVDVVGELDFRDGLHALGSTANGKAHDALFGQRCVEYSLSAEFRVQVHGAAKDTPESDIFAEEKHTLISRQGSPQSGIDSLVEVEALGGNIFGQVS